MSYALFKCNQFDAYCFWLQESFVFSELRSGFLNCKDKQIQL
ncbi:hypothetical protein RchiOBHm_Chr7g0208161 [Rosa chinensis]|uniref:Uncharacterized protein n=1 Tax=Rosa chinensis TaxID=74649 RepID=A0A2P6P9M6_ROSCH|nr:hypothetical protein RchiOBHm_Chr7g0208161 [Rosa chinensis]